MIPAVQPLNLDRVRVYPLAERTSLTRVDEILIAPDSKPVALSDSGAPILQQCVSDIRRARERGATVLLIYGAHLLRNGAALLLDSLMAGGWITHVATNGAGTIHDWEYSWLGASTESVEENVATGTFGTWDETAKYIHAALMTGALDGLGYGASLGRFIAEEGALIPSIEEMEQAIITEPGHPLTGARAALLRAVRVGHIQAGHLSLRHAWKHASIMASAWRHGVPATVHPGIGYDIIANHPIFSGEVIGRASALDFRLFGGSVDCLDGGVVLSIGSAIMGPQVFEKSLSCVNNLRLQHGRPIVQGHSIYVVDLQDGGGWDWSQGEPPKDNPAYYLRFCKSYSRMGATMRYAQCDNAAFVHHLHRALAAR
jgi:hypothetical protein